MKEFAPLDEELEAYRNGEEWDPQKAEERRKLKVRGHLYFLEKRKTDRQTLDYCNYPETKYKQIYENIYFTIGCHLLFSIAFLSVFCFWHLPQEQAALEMEASSRTQKRPVSPNSNYRDKYSHLIGTSAAKDAAHTLEANQSYGCGEYSNNWPSLLLVCDVSLPSFESHLLFLQSLWPIRGTRALSRKL